MTDEIRRIDIGFQGGQVLPARVKHKDYDGLRTALGNERADRWFELDTVDSKVGRLTPFPLGPQFRAERCEKVH